MFGRTDRRPEGGQHMKRIVVTITLAAAAACILALSAAAQSQGKGHSGGAAAGSMGGRDVDASRNSSSKLSGPRTMDEMLTDNKRLASKLSSLLPPVRTYRWLQAGSRTLGSSWPRCTCRTTSV